MPKIFFLNKFNYIFTLLFLLLSFYFYSLSANAQLKASDSVPPALSELVKSAQAGDPTAQIDLGKRYASGQGIEKNRDKAKEWLEKAAEKNFGIAMLELGKLLYNDGTNTPADRIPAYKWLTLAESKGYGYISVEAARLKKPLAAAMSPDEIFQGQKAAQEWFPNVNPVVATPPGAKSIDAPPVGSQSPSK